MGALTGQTVQSTYKDLLQVDNSNSGITSTFTAIEDGEGTSSELYLQTAGTTRGVRIGNGYDKHLIFGSDNGPKMSLYSGATSVLGFALTGITGGSTTGFLLNGNTANAHVVIAISANDTADGFHIVGPSTPAADAAPDRAYLSVKNHGIGINADVQQLYGATLSGSLSAAGNVVVSGDPAQLVYRSPAVYIGDPSGNAGAGGNGNYLAFHNRYDHTAGVDGKYIDYAHDNVVTDLNGRGGSLRFRSNQAGSRTTTMTMTTGGNVGIGNFLPQHADPAYTLHLSAGGHDDFVHFIQESCNENSTSIQAINYNNHSQTGSSGLASGEAALSVQAVTGAAVCYFSSRSSLSGAGDHSAGANSAVATRWVLGQLANGGTNHNVGTGNPYTLGRVFHFLQQLTTNSGATYSNTANAIRFGVEGGIYPGVDDNADLGHGSMRWDDVYATNGTIQTSDETLKDNIADSSLGLTFINSLKPRTYKWKGYSVDETNDVVDTDGKVIDTVTTTRTKSASRTHYGLIAQEVKTSLDSAGVDTKDFAGYIDGNITNDVEGKGKLGLRYNEFISPLIKAVQELSAKVEAQQATIDELKAG
jgi:hypothetical protein